MPATRPPSAQPLPDPDQAWKALDLVNDWIKHSEGKAVAVLATTGVVGGALYNLAKDNLVKDLQHPDYIITTVVVSCAVAAFAAGLSAASAITPRRKVKGQPEDYVNLLFYSHIAKAYGDDSPSYEKVLETLSSNKIELTQHIANQVHANSIVADRKFALTGRSIKALVASLALLGILAAMIGWGF